MSQLTVPWFLTLLFDVIRIPPILALVHKIVILSNLVLHIPKLIQLSHSVKTVRHITIRLNTFHQSYPVLNLIVQLIIKCCDVLVQSKVV
jgi:hypothetical protein